MCIQCVSDNSSILLDRDKHEAAKRMVDIMNAGATVMMMSIGRRTGLYDVMSEMPPSTSDQIAANAGLNERYVREWLGAMVTCGFVEYEKTTETYYLLPEYAAFLTRAAGSDNLATLAQMFPIFGSVEDRVVECFKYGGGVPYSAYTRFHDVMAEDSGQNVVPALLDHILPLVPDIKTRLRDGIDVLDVGCGKGLAMVFLARTFPNSRFTGYDFSKEAIQAASVKAEKYGLNNIQFKIQDTALMQDTERYDLITAFDAIHDQVHPQTVLDNIYRALRPGGVYLMMDIDMRSNVGDNREHPFGTLIYTFSCLHCMTVSLANGGDGLGAAWGTDLAQRMIRNAGFRDIEIKRLPHDPLNCFYVLPK